MLSLPDFKEKEILYVNGAKDLDAKLLFRNSNITYKKHDSTANQISCHKVFSIFVIGEMSFTSGLVRNCMKHGITLSFLGRNLYPYATIGSSGEGNYVLREKQYVLTSGEEMNIAKKLMKIKVRNQLALLYAKSVRDIGKTALRAYLEDKNKKIDLAPDRQSLLGIEGSVTKDFFSLYFGDLGWYRRMPRAKVDELNVLLDMGYTFLFNYIDSMLRLYGFDEYKGVYHQLYFQRKSLVCDLEEPFRCIIDRAVRKMFTQKKFDSKDFKKSKGKYYLNPQKSGKYAWIFLYAILKYKEDIFKFTQEYYYHVMDSRNSFPSFKIR